MSKLQNFKRKIINSFVAVESFDAGCSLMYDMVNDIYNAQKALVFFHSERKSRYTIRKIVGINKSSAAQFNFLRQSLITQSARSKEIDTLSGKVSIDDWPRFKNSLKNKLKDSGLKWIVPFWSGPVCLGGIIFSSVSNIADRKAREFESAIPEITHLLEIAFIKKLMKREVWENQVLLDVGRKVVQLSDLDEILNHIIDSIKDIIEYDAAGIFLLKLPEKKLQETAVRGFSKELQDNVSLKVGKGIVGWAIENNKEVNVPDVRKDKRYVMARKGTRSEVVVPIIFGKNVMGAFVLESDKIHHFKYHDIELLRAFAVQTAIVLENSKLLFQALEASQLHKELEIARNIQKALLPNKLPKLKGYDIAAVNITSHEIGGDLYDFIPLPDHQVGVAIGDISGKGVPGALLMAAINSTFRSVTRQAESTHEIVRLLNEELYEYVEPGKFASFFFGIIDSESDVFRSTNAGHNPPVIVRKNGDWVTLKIGGPLIGVLPDYDYGSENTGLRLGDILFFYTDGVSEALNASEEEFGFERIIECLSKNRHFAAKDILQKMMEGIKKFSDKTRQDDDITIVVVKKTS